MAAGKDRGQKDKAPPKEAHKAAHPEGLCKEEVAF